MSTYTINTMKFISYPAPTLADHTVQSLAQCMDIGYTNAIRKYGQRAFSASALAKVVIELTVIYQKGLELVGKDAPLEKINAVIGELEFYKVPEELKSMFSEPCVIPFPTPFSKKKKK